MLQNKIQSQNTLNKLILLVLMFIIGVFSLIGIHLFFQSLISKLDSKTENQKAKIEIGQIIIQDLNKIKSDFYELATISTNQKTRILLKNEISKTINHIKSNLNVLNKGGSVDVIINLNILNNPEIKKTITYFNETNEISLESIDIDPKLSQFQSMLIQIDEMIKQSELFLSQKDYEKYAKQVRKIKRFYKKSPAFFDRVIENTNRLQYDGHQILKDLENRIILEKKQYEKLEMLFVLFIILAVIFLGMIIAKQIIASTKTLEIQKNYSRGVLDGQPNIVVVSDGTKMIDANTALIDFFENYSDFEDFKKEHLCICDFFIDLNDPQYIIDKDYDGLRWHDYIMKNQQKLHKVALQSRGVIKYFTITAKEKQVDEDHRFIIISLNDISKEIEIQKELKSFSENLEEIVKEKTQKLTELNENLEQKINLEVEKSREKDKKIIQQTRFAALGEMIGNIAHQWRQPLSAISSTASSASVQIDLGIASNNDIKKSFSNIMNYIGFLTQTIEDFRSFFKEDKEKTNFDMVNIFRNTKTITSASYSEYHIELHEKYNENHLMTNGFPNELSQVFLNILNNAKDVLVEKVHENRIVLIETFITDNSCVFEITDNAGGINDSIKDKIFDPYFTTKHQSQGTGIGLYMSKEIIEKHMQGNLTAFNKEFELDNKKEFGACFRIELPKI